MIDSQLAKSSLGLTTFLSVDWDEGHSYLCRTEHCRDTPVRPWKERRAPVCRPRAHNEAPVWRPWTCGCSQRRELKTPLGPAARRAAPDHLTGGASGPRVARVLEFCRFAPGETYKPDHGQRPRVRRPCTEVLGARARGEPSLHHARQAVAIRLHRELQRQAALRMPQRTRVPQTPSLTRTDRRLPRRLQLAPATQHPRLTHAARVFGQNRSSPHGGLLSTRPVLRLQPIPPSVNQP